MSKKKNNDHLHDLLEAQEHQYNPWYYPFKGDPPGKKPLHMEAPGKPLWRAIEFFVGAGLGFFFIITHLINTNITKIQGEIRIRWDWENTYPALLIFFPATILVLAVGFGYLRQHKRGKLEMKQKPLRKQHKKRKKK